ncbi:MAG TPA: lysophospholipid acyltransferase family protein [Steroidobacteraceae bacterium]|nr:lysophospholipid acyltransferase family protein [Steroidobacteraceae bacterium]
MTPPAAAVSASAPQGADRSALWVRAIAALPWWVLYGVAHSLAWLASSVFPYRKQVVRENLSLAFPELDEPRLRDLMRRYYRGFAEVLVEIVKSVRLPPDEIRRRVRVEGLDAARALIAGGSPVLLVAAHQCNWEWMLLALTLELSYPLDAAYKPLVDPWAEREMLKLRTRFGSRLVPAQGLLGDIIKRGRTPRAIALVADQEPRTSEHKHWTRFLNRDTAFYVGAEEIARVTRFAAFFVGMRRTARGHYAVTLSPLAAPAEMLAAGELTERYVRFVEQQIRAAPADWPWSHKRWKLKRSLYGRS